MKRTLAVALIALAVAAPTQWAQSQGSFLILKIRSQQPIGNGLVLVTLTSSQQIVVPSADIDTPKTTAANPPVSASSMISTPQPLPLATPTTKPAPVPKAAPATAAPPGASAHCRDGSYSSSKSRNGTCSSHGGVAQWL